MQFATQARMLCHELVNHNLVVYSFTLFVKFDCGGISDCSRLVERFKAGNNNISVQYFSLVIVVIGKFLEYF